MAKYLANINILTVTVTLSTQSRPEKILPAKAIRPRTNATSSAGEQQIWNALFGGSACPACTRTEPTKFPKKSKTASPEVSRAKKSKSNSLEVGTRPEEKYGVRRRVWARRKDQRASQSRDRAVVA